MNRFLELRRANKVALATMIRKEFKKDAKQSKNIPKQSEKSQKYSENYAKTIPCESQKDPSVMRQQADLPQNKFVHPCSLMPAMICCAMISCICLEKSGFLQKCVVLW